MGWYNRCMRTADVVIPWLCGISTDLCEFCENIYNSPDKLRKAWEKLKVGQDFGTLGDQVEAELRRESVLLSEIAGDAVSRVMTDYMIDRHPGNDLGANGKSDYPDLYLKSFDYRGLSGFVRSGNYGAALKGKERRPVRVPDGIEIKTCRQSFHVDCHHPHTGLHVVLLYDDNQGVSRMTDLLAGFLRECDYHISKINTGATTRKASFGRDRFVSLLPNMQPAHGRTS